MLRHIMFYDICHVQLVQAHDSIADKSECFVMVCPYCVR